MKWLTGLLVLLLTSCLRETKKHIPKQVMHSKPFVLTKEERSIMDIMTFSDSFYIDSFATVSGFKDFRDGCRAGNVKCGITFQFKADNLSGKVATTIPLAPPSITLGGQVRNHKKKLWIDLFPDGTVAGYKGGYFTSSEKALEHLDSTVAIFLKEAYEIDRKEDKTKLAYWPVSIILVCSSDSIGYMNERLTEITKGYIYYLRQQSMVLFEKKIDSLTSLEKTTLANSYPLYASMIHYKD